jgi:Matrixin
MRSVQGGGRRFAILRSFRPDFSPSCDATFESFFVSFASRIRWLSAVAAAAAFACAVPASAYTTAGGRWSQPGGLGNPITLTYSYQNMFDGGIKMPNGQPLPKTLIRDSIEEALGLWAEVAPFHFVEVRDDGLAYNRGTTAFGQIRFKHIPLNGPDPPPPADPIAKAQAYYPSPAVVGGDVEYDNLDRWQEVGTTPVPDILGATIHELGHSLGLGHSLDDDAAMYWIFNRFSGIGTGELHADDIAGIRYIYGAGKGSVKPLVGTWQDRPILPTSVDGVEYKFDNVTSGLWFDPPTVSEFRYTAEPGTLFSRIAEFPTGFGPLTLTIDGNTIGQFNGGQSYNFLTYANGGVSEFTISGIKPPGDLSDPVGFPLRLMFGSATGSFTMTAIPEPASAMLCLLGMLALQSIRRKRV